MNAQRKVDLINNIKIWCQRLAQQAESLHFVLPNKNCWKVNKEMHSSISDANGKTLSDAANSYLSVDSKLGERNTSAVHDSKATREPVPEDKRYGSFNIEGHIKNGFNSFDDYDCLVKSFINYVSIVEQYCSMLVSNVTKGENLQEDQTELTPLNGPLKDAFAIYHGSTCHYYTPLVKGNINYGEAERDMKFAHSQICWDHVREINQFVFGLRYFDQESLDSSLEKLKVELFSIRSVLKFMTLLGQSDNHHNSISLYGEINDTPLHYACISEDTILLKLFLDSGADVNWESESLLYEACKNKDEHLVKLLLQNGACVDSVTREGLTPFHSLAENYYTNAVNIAKALIDVQFDVNSIDDYGKTCLHRMRDLHQNKDLFRYLIPLVRLTIQDKLGRTPLHYYNGELLFSEDMGSSCSNFADVLTVKDIFGLSSLHTALCGLATGHKLIRISALKAMIDEGASVNVASNLGVTPLHWAVMQHPRCALEIVTMLLERGADPNARDQFLSTPLHLAVFSRSKHTVFHALIKYGGDVNSKDCRGLNVVEYAKQLKFIEIEDAIKSSLQVSIDTSSNHKVARTIGTIINLHSEVDSLAQEIAKRIGELDTRFECIPKACGSVVEEMQIGEADEFDYMFLFPKLGNLCKAVFDSKGEAKLKSSETREVESEAYEEFFDSKRKLMFKRLKKAFLVLVKKAIFTKEIWSSTNLVYLPESILTSGPSVCLKLLWHGLETKALLVSIDIVFTLPILSCNADFSHLPPSTANLIHQFGSYVVLSTSHTARFSMSHVETFIIQSLPNNVKEGYRKAKSIRTELISDTYSHRRKQHSNERNEVVKTYLLKTSLFHVLRRSGVLSINEGAVIDKNILHPTQANDWCRMIYQFIVDFTTEYNWIPSFFFPEREVNASHSKCAKILHLLMDDN